MTASRKLSTKNGNKIKALDRVDKGESLPPGIIELSQPMGDSAMTPFKNRLRDVYMKYDILNGIFTDAAQKRRHIAKSVLQAWEEVTEVAIRNGFLKAGLTATGPRDMEGVFATGMSPPSGRGTTPLGKRSYFKCQAQMLKLFVKKRASRRCGIVLQTKRDYSNNILVMSPFLIAIHLTTQGAYSDECRGPTET
ncbi:LOW QUALITY PROTEIN: Hypothetical protein PHPALM_186 [Phytophthora palmivora]|uniref:DDE-1 domain-containing protein n=1 Tax=Phytophthora palmivora TaxID=4796 RepID=A0A2P4YVI1_9STRA|nr:LOW QUALITY PROTEIN: Hypothetical protein PHPALM_186 [Phytophthora palmivora]